MKVVEIFDSIQGEGQWMGAMRTFVRFAGCNLQCPFCDEATKYGQAKEMSFSEIASACKQEGVVLTGGEPTLQPELIILIGALMQAGKSVAIETNGTGAIPPIKGLWVTCSPKAPDYEVCSKYDEIKLVVDEQLTFEQAKEIARNTCSPVWLQPCDVPDPELFQKSKRRIIEWVTKEPTLFRAGIQLHKWYNER